MVDYLLGLAVFFSYWLISAFVTFCLVCLCFMIDSALRERKLKRFWEAERKADIERRKNNQ